MPIKQRDEGKSSEEFFFSMSWIFHGSFTLALTQPFTPESIKKPTVLIQHGLELRTANRFDGGDNQGQALTSV